MPETRARTSAIRVGAMRPGSPRITVSGAGCNAADKADISFFSLLEGSRGATRPGALALGESRQG